MRCSVVHRLVSSLHSSPLQCLRMASTSMYGDYRREYRGAFEKYPPQRPPNRHQKRRAELDKIPTSSRTEKVQLLHRRLVEYEKDMEEGKGKEGKCKWNVDSEAAERLINANRDRYSLIFEKRDQEMTEKAEKQKKEDERLQGEEDTFPFRADSTVEIVSESGEKVAPAVSCVDQGFFVSGDMYVDEYTAALVSDLPDDEMTVGSRMYVGDDDAIETIDFQLPAQSAPEPREKYSNDDDEDEGWGDDGGRSDRQCKGCGANFHCRDEDLPGYLPPILFTREERKADEGKGDPSLCKRCHLIKHHHFLPNVNVCPVDYAKMLSALRGRNEVLIVLVVDITDLPGSIHRALPAIIGGGKPMIVVANKVDLLPPDARSGYLKRFKMCVERAIADAKFLDSFNILHTALISAKTGFGVEDLITEIHMKWTNVKGRLRDDMYIVGCTNAGKSTLFNTLLQSDLCKVRAVDVVERATTSVWPGTTLSLLKFPVMRPSSYKLELRRRRLVSHKAWLQKEAYARKLSLQRTGHSNFAVPVEPVYNTYKQTEEDLQPRAMSSLIEGTMDGEEGENKGRAWSLNDEMFEKGVWCYDTPGTVNQEQLLTELSLRELVNVVPNRLLRPRTAIVQPGESIIVGGLAHIDVLKADKKRPIYVTVCANDLLPLTTIETERLDEWMKKNRGRSVMGAPVGDEERLSRLPPMIPTLFTIAQQSEYQNYEKEHDESLSGMADVILTSIGWAMISTHANVVDVRVSLPGGRGVSLRQPPLLPYSILLRGPRIPGTNLYKVRPPEFPVNVRRQAAERRRRLHGRGGNEREHTDSRTLE